MDSTVFLASEAARKGFLDYCNAQKPGGCSAWRKGVYAYALELAEFAEDADTDKWHVKPSTVKEMLLNGAADWHEYSYGGSAHIYDCDIAALMCSPSALARYNGGERNPARETWLDVQARALSQAGNLVERWVSAWNPEAK